MSGGPGIGRRAVLAGTAAWLAAPALARAAAGAEAALPLAAVLADSGLGALTALAVADLDSGRIIEGHRQAVGQPPASVAKIVTSLYALETLGPDYRFITRILGDGPVVDGVLGGDLVLAGDGDPVLDTDALGNLVRALGERGLTRVAGGFRVAAGALPAMAAIDPDQPAEAAYNPAISGINLNFNRVCLAWTPGEAGPQPAFSAPGVRFSAPAPGFRADLAADGPPRHRMDDVGEVWTLPREGMRGRGSMWLPVRAPETYAGAIFGRLAADAGLALPAPVTVATAPGGALALHASPPLTQMLRDMLAFSTNLTAEVVGLRAGQARGLAPGNLAGSAAAMSAWARSRFGIQNVALVNHSGLADASRLAPADLVAVLAQAAGLRLPELLKPRPILDAAQRPVEIGGVQVLSKTGTMDFVSGLAGYMDGRRRLAFAIFASDPALRRLRPEDRAWPPGGAAWLARARALEQALLRRWATLYAA